MHRIPNNPLLGLNVRVSEWLRAGIQQSAKNGKKQENVLGLSPPPHHLTLILKLSI